MNEINVNYGMKVAYNNIIIMYLVYMQILSQDEAPGINSTEIVSSFLLVDYALYLFLILPQFSSRQYRSLLTPEIYTHNDMD